MSPFLTYINNFHFGKKTLIFFLFGSFIISGSYAQKDNDYSLKDSVLVNEMNAKALKHRYYYTDSLLSLSQRSYTISEQIKYFSGKNSALLNIASYYADNGQVPKAITTYKKIINSENPVKSETLTLTKNNLGLTYYYMGNYAKALSLYLEALEIARNSNDIKMLSVLNENIASLYNAQKDYKQALIFLDKAVKLNDSIGDELRSAKTYCNFGDVYAKDGNYELAMFNINKSIGVFEKHKNMRWVAQSYKTKGNIYLHQKKYEWALRWYDQSALLHSKIENLRDKTELLNGMTSAYLGLGKDSLALPLAKESFQISKNINSLENLGIAARNLYLLNKKVENYPEALNFHELYQSISDSTSRAENNHGLALQKTKMEYEKQKEQIVAQNNQELAKQRRFLYFGFVLLLILGGIIYLVQRSRKANKSLNDRLQAKQEILENREKELEEINLTKDKLFSIIGHDLRGPIGALLEVLKMIRTGDIKKSEFNQFVPRLINDVDHISFTLNNLLSWGMSQMNGSTTKPTLYGLELLIDNNVRLLTETAKNKSITIKNNISQELHSYSDANQVDIVIRNIISNALKFTPEKGTITINAKEKTKLWIISISDTGIGMDEETLGKIFAKNESFTTFGTNNEKGTGLGLSLCKEMVENNGGSIWVKSEIGKGSSFFFSVPKGEKEYKNVS